MSKLSAVKRLLLFMQAAGLAGQLSAASYSWQEPHSKVLPNGDLEWAPHPFVFEKSAPIRYIYFEAGNDENSGDGPSKPWKHHPWDSNARSNSAAA